MLILQAAFDGRTLALWGERELVRPREKPRGTAPRSPFDPDPQNLADAVRLLFDAGGPALAIEDAAIWLPTLANLPVPSSPLLAELPAPEARPLYHAWTVAAYRLHGPSMVHALTACIQREHLAPGILVGKTLAYWAQALRYAASLAAREQQVPGVEAGPPQRGRWRTFIPPFERPRFLQLVRAMPLVARALVVDPEAPFALPAEPLLQRFLDDAVDALTRLVARPGPAEAEGRSRPFDSIHDAWLTALRSESGRLELPAAQFRDLARQVHAWQRPLRVTATSPFRLSFRLEEPEAEAPQEGDPRRHRDPQRHRGQRPKNRWALRYFLQGADDPSLYIPLEEAWQPEQPRDSPLAGRAWNSREYVVGSLGEAGRLCRPVGQSLAEATPTGANLSTQAAFKFLHEEAWLLEQAGFGVQFPAWWTRKGTKVRLGAQIAIQQAPGGLASALSLSTLVDFDWQLALGDEVLTKQELQALARLKEPLVRIRGHWVQLTPQEIEAAIRYWQQKETGSARLGDVIRMALGDAKPPGGLPFAGVKASGWIGELLEQLEGHRSFEELASPEGMRGELRPYQQRGYSWLHFLTQWGLGACLADDMGLGKTVQTLALLQQQWERNGKKPSLLVCPMSVVGNWQKEAARFTPELPVLTHHGPDRIKGADFAESCRKHALVLTSYPLLHRDLELLAKVDWSAVILDEAQNIKNPETKQARAARQIPSAARIALTGTPVENHILDLWSIMEFLNPGFLGTQAQFRRNFFVPIQANQDPEASRALQRLTGPFILRRLKTDKSIIADLPDKLEMKVFCSLTKEQASLYEAVVRDITAALESAEGIQRKGLVLAALVKLKQVCNHPVQFLGDNSAIPGRSGKLQRLGEMLDEVLEAGERSLIFTQFAEMGEIIRKHLQDRFGREVLFLHGGKSKKQRDAMVARFQQDDGPPIFVLSVKAGGTGLNLTRANHVFHYDRWWNPAVEDQATDRAFRIGQTRNVQVHKFLCAGTVEERIDEMIERKQVVAKKIVGTGEGWLTELSNDQLRGLFDLRKDTIGVSGEEEGT